MDIEWDRDPISSSIWIVFFFTVYLLNSYSFPYWCDIPLLSSIKILHKCVGLFLSSLFHPTSILFCPTLPYSLPLYSTHSFIWPWTNMSFNYCCFITFLIVCRASPLPYSSMDNPSHSWSFLFHIHFRINLSSSM